MKEIGELGTSLIPYFNFPFLDTSAISIYDFSTQFTNFKTINTETHNLTLQKDKSQFAKIEMKWM